MNNTKIDWCDSTLNPVVGCKNNCRYCYARKINDRFGLVKDFNEPQFFPERLKQLYAKTPKTIFMDSMSDIDYWKKEWVHETLSAIAKNRQHKYIFLTKGLNKEYRTGIYDLISTRNIYDLEKIVFVGKTVTHNKEHNHHETIWDFLSIEPLLEPIDFYPSQTLRQVIIGAETGHSPNKVVPKKEWIDDIVKVCDRRGIRVFMKESLKDIMGDSFRQDKLIWDE